MRRFLLGMAMVVAGVLAISGVASAAGHGSLPVRSVSNPPAVAPSKLKLKVGTKLTAVSVYASPARKVTRGAVRLARSAKVQRHRISVGVPGKLGPGVWFVVVCPVTAHRGCASSRAAMAKVATKLSAPIDAHPGQEAAQAASATIGSAGGTLDATGADGTRYHLVIAAGSVPDGTQITMTPVSSLGGGPAGAKFVAGVQLGPEGLTLIHGGTLTITPAHSVPIANQVGYGYDGTGDDVHQVPLAPTRAIEIPLAHFSGVGLLNAAENALAASGSGILDKYSALIANEMWLARMGYISEQTAFNDSLDLIPKMLSDVMSVEVPPGLNDDDAAIKAGKDLVTVARVSELLGGARDSVFNEIKPTLLKLYEGIYKRAQQKCANNHDLSQIPKIRETDRDETLIVGGQGEYHGLAVDNQCLRFRIDFDSSVQMNAGSGGSGSWNFEYVAHPTVTYDLRVLAISGATTGSYADASGTITGNDGGSVTVTSGTGARFQVDQLVVPIDPKDTSPPTLKVALNVPMEQYHADDQGYTTDYTDDQWLTDFNYFHQPQGDDTVLTLERGSGELVARGTWSNSGIGDAMVTETTTVDVFHTPPAYG